MNNPVGIEEKNSSFNALNVYPNPSSGMFKVQIVSKNNGVENSVIKIANVFGEEIFENKTIEAKTDLDLSALNNGVYFLNLFQDNKLISTKKLIKE